MMPLHLRLWIALVLGAVAGVAARQTAIACSQEVFGPVPGRTDLALHDVARIRGTGTPRREEEATWPAGALFVRSGGQEPGWSLIFDDGTTAVLR